MLIDENSILYPNPMLALIGSINGNGDSNRKIQTGIYEITHFGSSSFLEDYESYPDLSINSYGVCDDYQQILDQCPELQDENRKFVITLTAIIKALQPSDGGWRWHRWGPYIGKHNPQNEYIYDEPDIDKVYVYHIYEKIDN